MLHSVIMMVALVSTIATQEASPDPSFLETILVVDANPDKGELTFENVDGKQRTVHEGDLLEELDGARVKEIGKTILVLTRVVSGEDGQEGEALIVVRFGLSSGKTKVREYRTVPDVSPTPPPRRNDP